MLVCNVGFVSQQSEHAFFVRGFGCALFILKEDIKNV